MSAIIAFNPNDIANKISSILSPISQEHHNLIANTMETRIFECNELVYEEGNVPTNIMCLLEGKVKIYKNGVGNRSQILRTVSPIEFFGYGAYLSRENYLTSAMALERSVIALIPMQTILQLIRENNNICLFFFNNLARLLGNSYNRTVNLTQKHIRGRLAESLLMLEDCYGFEHDGQTLTVRLSREDLANMSSMTTSNAIRTLSAFASEGLITVSGRKIKIINHRELSHISILG
ncbi:MAG: Crp/Fnr family transcriptional regulator [Prevotella sp.]|nr:Crp/Fnr family transcriptional regulator [Prevotella sp.]